MNTCEYCGQKMYSDVCSWCHEEVLIEQQYVDLGMPVPKSIEDAAEKHRDEIAERGQ